MHALSRRACAQASATPKVRDDIISVLRLKQPRLIKGSFNRPNIAYQVDAWIGPCEGRLCNGWRGWVAPGTCAAWGCCQGVGNCR